MQDKKDLKIAALLERISQITQDYENRLADFRVEYTLLSQRLKESDNVETDITDHSD